MRTDERLIDGFQEPWGAGFEDKNDFQSSKCLYLQENISFLDPTRKARPHHWQHHKLGKLYLEDVEADPAAFIYVWMVHRGGEPSVGQMVSLVGILRSQYSSSYSLVYSTFSRGNKNLICGGSRG